MKACWGSLVVLLLWVLRCSPCHHFSTVFLGLCFFIKGSHLWHRRSCLCSLCSFVVVSVCDCFSVLWCSCAMTFAILSSLPVFLWRVIKSLTLMILVMLACSFPSSCMFVVFMWPKCSSCYDFYWRSDLHMCVSCQSSHLWTLMVLFVLAFFVLFCLLVWFCCSGVAVVSTFARTASCHQFLG